MIKAFFDSNVFIDAFSSRDRTSSSVTIISKVITGEIKGFIASKQITDIYYVLRKYGLDEQKRKEILKVISNNFKIIPTLGSDIIYCLNHQNLKDFEDDLLDEICKVNCIQYFITSNLKDFENSKNIVIDPQNFLTIFNSSI